MTPRFILCLPKCLQIVVSWCYFTVLVVTFPLLLGPVVLLKVLFVMPATRRLLRDYQEQSDIVEGRIVERSKHILKFFNNTRQVTCITVEYNVGDDGTYRKEFLINSQCIQEVLGFTSTVELLVIHGKPKSAMIKLGMEMNIKGYCSDHYWKIKPLGRGFVIITSYWIAEVLYCLGLSFWAQVFLISIFTHVSMFSWNTLLHGCVLGVFLFVITALLYWWWDPVTTRKHAFLENAELVDGNDGRAEASMPFDNHDRERICGGTLSLPFFISKEWELDVMPVTSTLPPKAETDVPTMLEKP